VDPSGGGIMKILLDTNIIIHRETQRVIRDDIGILFKWIDRLHFEKYIHPHTIKELSKYQDKETVKSFMIKIGSYNVIQSIPKLSNELVELSKAMDVTENDKIDTEILNIQLIGITDLFITEDKKVRNKAKILGIGSTVLSIEEFLEKVTNENPQLKDYKILSVRKMRFGETNLHDSFFDSFRTDYIGFDKWFIKKNDEFAYVCFNESQVLAFLYLKLEGVDEVYSDITPSLRPKKRLKIGTFKVMLNGYKLGERFLKIVFDNAIHLKVEEIYVTIFDNSIEQERLISLLEDYGFNLHGVKESISGKELVYVRSLQISIDRENQKYNFPFIDRKARVFLVPIYEQYHTNLFPDSILKTESPLDFVENEPFRNAISKVYISRSHYKDLIPGDIIIFYRTGGLHKSVISTIGVVESVKKDINSFESFKKCCGKRSVFSDDELRKHWDYYPTLKPFVVNFLYTYSFPKRINLKRLIELGIVKDIQSAPRGFELINSDSFDKIIEETKTDESIIVN
jgi:predicted nucleic acid-binding protein